MKPLCVVTMYFHTLNLSATSWQFAHLYNFVVQVAKTNPATIESAVARYFIISVNEVPGWHLQTPCNQMSTHKLILVLHIAKQE